jgi:hypothetical protein
MNKNEIFFEITWKIPDKEKHYFDKLFNKFPSCQQQLSNILL